MSFSGSRIGEILVRKGYLSAEDVEQGLARSKASGELLGETLVSMGVISPDQLAEALAEQSGLPYVDLSARPGIRAAFHLIPSEIGFRHSVLPYLDENESLTVVVSDPFDLPLQQRLEGMGGKSVQFAVASPAAIRTALKIGDGSSDVLKEASENLRASDEVHEDANLEVLDREVAKDRSPVVKLVNMILLAAINRAASDVHFEIYPSGIVTKYRIDGVLVNAMDTLDRSNHDALVARLKVMAGLDVAEKRAVQDGRFKMRYEGRDIDFRISIVPTAHGEDIVIRILDRLPVIEQGRQLNLKDLQLTETSLERFRRGIVSPYGMVLLTGPTGSGKTTTLYAALNELNNGERKIVTIEDPVEYQLDGIVQIPLNARKNVTFASGLKSILRHDPDVIMVGEIRDADTAHIAVQSALTGHLLLSTLHSNSSIDSIARIQHFGIDPYDLVSAVNCIVAQRLIRLVCRQCKKQADYDASYLHASGIDGKDASDIRLFRGAGCKQCHGTGYSGRMAIAEVLLLTDQIREMVLAREPASRLRQVAASEGMVPLRQAAIEKALQGATSLEEVNRVTSLVV